MVSLYIFLSFILFLQCLQVHIQNPAIKIALLIFIFILSGVIYIKIGLKFIGLALVLIYAGGISILFLFLITFLNLRSEFNFTTYETKAQASAWKIIIVLKSSFLFYTESQFLILNIEEEELLSTGQYSGDIIFFAYGLFRMSKILIGVLACLLLVVMLLVIFLIVRQNKQIQSFNFRVK